MRPKASAASMSVISAAHRASACSNASSASSALAPQDISKSLPVARGQAISTHAWLTLVLVGAAENRLRIVNLQSTHTHNDNGRSSAPTHFIGLVVPFGIFANHVGVFQIEIEATETTRSPFSDHHRPPDHSTSVSRRSQLSSSLVSPHSPPL